MFHDRATYSRISRIDERALPIVLENTEYSFDELLDIENSVLIRQRNLQLLMIEINKTKNNLNPSFMEDFFVEKGAPAILEILVLWCQRQIQQLKRSKPYGTLEVNFGNHYQVK